MVDWQVTAATLRCNTIEDEVTLLVYKDWSIKCTGYLKLTGSRGAASKALKNNSRSLACQGTGCELATEYRKKLQDEEVHK